MWRQKMLAKFPQTNVHTDYMENPLMWISKFWIEFESLLFEAVQRNCRSALLHLLDYEEQLHASEIIPKTKNFGRERDSSHALILAARTGNYQLMKLFLDKHYSIALPHRLDCTCLQCQDNKLGQSKRRLEALQALSNPLYISLTSEDPFLTAFKLCVSAREFGVQDDCFENNYQELAEENQKFCLCLLDEVESEMEGCCLMAHKKICEYLQKEDHLQCDDVTFIHMAIEHNQKDVVAHPISQHFITSIVFDNIPRWRTSTMKYKIFFIFVATLLYPITSFASIFAPCSSAGQLGKRPLVKFINVGASFVTFLCLLAVMASAKRDHNVQIGLMNGGEPNQIEIVVFVWLIGLIVGEVQQLSESGLSKYFSSGWNFIDISMMTLMLTSYLTWIVMYFCCYNPAEPRYKDIYELVDGLFALAMILSFFRLVYLMQISSYLGLLQLCLSKMIQVIFQFAFISVVVLFAFSVAMAFLSQSSGVYQGWLRTNHPHIYNNNTNASWITKILTVSYDGLPSTMVTLMWGGMNMVNLKSLQGLDDGSFIHMFSYLLFGLHYCASMIVLLNMLIAMMSNSYQYIQENLDVEHKFSRTVLWVDYIGEENSRPVPFNLIPSFDTMRAISKRICGRKNVFKRRTDIKRNMKPDIDKAAHNKYKNLCSVLLNRYLVKKHGFNYKDEHQEKVQDNAKFLAKVKLQCRMWTSKYEQFAAFCNNNISTEVIPICDVDTVQSPKFDHLYSQEQWDNCERNQQTDSISDVIEYNVGAIRSIDEVVLEDGHEAFEKNDTAVGDKSTVTDEGTKLSTQC